MRSTSPNRDKRHHALLLRCVLFAAVAALILRAEPGPGAVAFAAVFVVSQLVLLKAPLRFWASWRSNLWVGGFDLAMVGAGVFLSGTASRFLPVSMMLMVLVLAIGAYKIHTVIASLAIGALHTWLFIGNGQPVASPGLIIVEVLLLSAVALDYGYLVDEMHLRRRRHAAEELERHELIAMIKILEKITSSLDLRDVARTIVDHVNSVVPTVRCSMLMIDDQSERCFVLASHDDPNMELLELDLIKYPELREAITTRSPVIIDDVSSDPRMAAVRETLEGLDYQSLMVVPLTFGDDILGGLFLKTARTDDAFSDGERNFCNAVATASANALKNAVLHRQVHDTSRHQARTVKKLESILDYSTDLIITTDLDGCITEANAAAERMLGYGKERLIGSSYLELFSTGEDPELIDKVREASAVANYSATLSRHDGTELSMLLNMSVLCDEEGTEIGTVWLGRDVTRLKEMQLQLNQAEKLSTIGRVISGVAHELNNPLSVVLGFAQLLSHRNDDLGHSDYLEKITEAARRCRRIVGNLLSFSRAYRPKRERMTLNDVARNVFELKEYQLKLDNIEAALELDPELPETSLDRHQLEQVALNLVNNAQQALATIDGRQRRLTIKTDSVDGRVRLQVIDNGPGMSASTARKVFEPFFTTKDEGHGTGLGLSVSYGIVQEHDGQILVESRLGKGTTFSVVLPVIEAGAEPEAEVEPIRLCDLPEAEAEAGCRILVVDDEPEIVALLEEILDELGHSVDRAGNGEEALAKTRDRDYDLLITDVRMPDMDGISLYRNLVVETPRLKNRVIFITGDLADPETVGFLAGMEARTLPKPFDIDRLVRVVGETLDAAA